MRIYAEEPMICLSVSFGYQSPRDETPHSERQIPRLDKAGA